MSLIFILTWTLPCSEPLGSSLLGPPTMGVDLTSHPVCRCPTALHDAADFLDNFSKAVVQVDTGVLFAQVQIVPVAHILTVLMRSGV